VAGTVVGRGATERGRMGLVWGICRDRHALGECARLVLETWKLISWGQRRTLATHVFAASARSGCPTSGAPLPSQSKPSSGSQRPASRTIGRRITRRRAQRRLNRRKTRSTRNQSATTALRSTGTSITHVMLTSAGRYRHRVGLVAAHLLYDQLVRRRIQNAESMRFALL
jgi:hypothetical protein